MPKIKVKGQTVQAGELGKTDKHKPTHGRYQVHYLPASLTYTIDNENKIYRKWFMPMAKMEANHQWYNALHIPHIDGNSPEFRYCTYGWQWWNCQQCEISLVCESCKAVPENCFSMVWKWSMHWQLSKLLLICLGKKNQYSMQSVFGLDKEIKK